MMYGLPPFYNKNQTIMFKLIKEGELRFPDRPETTKEAKDFISRVYTLFFRLNLISVFESRSKPTTWSQARFLGIDGSSLVQRYQLGITTSEKSIVFHTLSKID
jgi:hypothetical protein